MLPADDKFSARRHMQMMEVLFGYPQRFGFGAWGRLLRASLTGSVSGIRIENYLWFWCYALARSAIYLFCLIPGAVFGAYTLLAMWFARRQAPLVLMSTNGITLQQKRPNLIRQIPWTDILEVRSVLAPPVAYWVLVLRTGEELPLSPMADVDTASIAAHGIPVIEAQETLLTCRTAHR